MKALPILQVRTAHSDYVIDQNTQTFSRTRREDDSNYLGRGTEGFNQGETYPYTDIVLNSAGGPLWVYLPGGGYIRSTAIESVKEVCVEA